MLLDSGGDISGPTSASTAPARSPRPCAIRYPLELAGGGDRCPIRRRTGRCGCSTSAAASGARACRTSSTRSPPSPRDWRLTILGGDTATAPARALHAPHARAPGRGRPRASPSCESVARADCPRGWPRTTSSCCPRAGSAGPTSPWRRCAAGMPVIATPRGRLREMVEPGRQRLAGRRARGPRRSWSCSGRSSPTRRCVRAARDRRALSAHRARPGRRDLPAARTSRWPPTPSSCARCDQQRHGRAAHRPRPGADPPPLVSVVIPYHGMHALRRGDRGLRRARRPIRGSRCSSSNDGSFAPEDVVLAELATRYPLRVVTQANRGLGGARNFGIALARGRYVLPLDADNVLEPTFVARVRGAARGRPRAAPTSRRGAATSRGRRPAAPAARRRLPARSATGRRWSRSATSPGTATAVFRRSIFDRHRFSEDLTSFEDWALYRELARAGPLRPRHPRDAVALPRAATTRCSARSGSRDEERLQAEMDALIREQEVAWVSKNG